MPYKILAINPGSSSTKIAVFEDEQVVFSTSIAHDTQDLLRYPRLFDQLLMRYESVVDALVEKAISLSDLSATVGRGGLLPPVKSGAYLVNEDMLKQLEKAPVIVHASNLGAALAFKMANPLGIPAYIYDPVTVDEMIDVVRITGCKSITRFGKGHNLNMRASALRFARENNREYEKLNLIVAHLGGGITSSLHSQGRIIDMISDDEGAFSPERAGGLPAQRVISACFEQGITYPDMMRKVQRLGGLMDHLGTTDVEAVEQRANAGDVYAKLIYEAMALNVSKDIARLSVVVNGRIDAIILTGSIAFSQQFNELITKRVAWIAPVHIIAGENEMHALANGALRVLRGEETFHNYYFCEKIP